MLKEIILALVQDRIQDVERTIRVSTDHIHGLLSKLKDRIASLETKVEEINKPFDERMFDVRNYVEERLSEGDVPIKLTSEQLRDALDDRSMEKFVEEAIGEIDLTDEVKDAIETLCNSGSLDDSFSDPKVIQAMADNGSFMYNLASELAGRRDFVNSLAEAFANSLRKSLACSKS